MKHEEDEVNAQLSPQPESPGQANIDRRLFLGQAAGIGAAAVFFGPASAAQQARRSDAQALTSVPCSEELGPQNRHQRQATAFKKRVAAAKKQLHHPLPCHARNHDEMLYADQRASYSKGLVHDSIGEVDSASYASLLQALKSGDPVDFELIVLGNPGGAGPAPGNTPVDKMINPKSGLAFDLEGADSHALTQPAAPPFASPWQAGEGIENTWMAHLRDVPFRLYASDPFAAAAIADLNAASDFRGPKVGGLVTAQTLLRDPFPGCTVGPYLSQFWYRSQPFGTQDIDPRSNTYAAGVDYMTRQADWVVRQNGVNPPFSNAPGGLVYMRNGRDIGAWVHVDVLFQGYFQAFLVMTALGVPANPGNPYNTSATQIGFGTLGGPNFAALVCEVATRALKAVWFQKWFLHRRLRPEVYLGRTHVHLTGQKSYDLHPDILNCGAVAETFSRHGTYLLPMAFPEGSPAHPSYGAGHATVAGACVTMLKALFDTNRLVTDFFTPQEPTDDGLALVPYAGPDVGLMTLTGELNKIASNVSFGRNLAGVHWRTDGEESILLGEQVAINVLRDQKPTYNEDVSYTFDKFDGTSITI
jgi:membrane-associated phospholipid phosphatase